LGELIWVWEKETVAVCCEHSVVNNSLNLYYQRTTKQPKQKEQFGSEFKTLSLLSYLFNFYIP